jgi:glutamyl-Q tRNA(Asp) synthetase
MARALEEVGTDLTWAVWTGAVWTSTVWQDSGQDSGQEQVKFVRAEPQLWGDVVLVRRDVPTSYHLSVVVDDALQNISHVLRGQDLYHATHIHRLLQALLSLPSPLYQHHRLIRDDEGHKLAKSNPRAAHEQSFYLRDLRKAGWSASELRAKLGLRVD